MNKRSALVAAACVLALAGCSEDPSGVRDGNLSAAGRGIAGSAGMAAGAAGSAGTFGNPGGGGSLSPIVPVEPGKDGEEVCGATSQEASQVVVQTTVEIPVEVTVAEPIALYIVLDRSGSMAFPSGAGMPAMWGGAGGWGTGPTLWDLAVDAISGLVNDPASANIDIALEYFPPDGFGDAQCDGVDASMPAVTLGRLPAHAANITSSLGATGPNGSGTPIEAALRGGALFCQGFKASTPDEECVVLLVTDGAPADCSEDFAALAQIAGDAFTNDGTKTFAIGIGEASFDLLDQVATAGGSDCDPAGARAACDATSGQLQAALTTIRDTVVTTSTRTEIREEIMETPLECEWSVPAPNPGEAFKADLVNVRFTQDEGVEPVTFGLVASPDACGSQAIAWHYDDPSAPSRLIACPETCNAIKAAPRGKIDILLGCPSIPLE